MIPMLYKISYENVLEVEYIYSDFEGKGYPLFCVCDGYFVKHPTKTYL
jgi:hypothetical protein